MRVRTQSETHELSAGSILVLDPEVVDEVEAQERSDMLLTVSLLR